MMESAQGQGRASSMDSGGGCGDGGAQLQGTNSAAAGDPDGGDWRALLPPVTRKRVVIMLYVTPPLLCLQRPASRNFFFLSLSYVRQGYRFEYL
jgi:hypothetical protein